MTYTILSVLSISLFIYSIVLARRSRINTFSRSLYSLVSILFMFALVFFWTCHYFTGAGINEAVLYHLIYGLKGAGMAEYGDTMALAAGGITLTLVTGILVFIYLRRPPEKKSRFNTLWKSLVILAAAFIAHPAGGFIMNRAVVPGMETGKNDAFSGYYRQPSLNSDHGNVKNLVFIYAESLERTYFNEALFPGLVPGLKSLEQNALSFTDISSVNGTACTIAGMVASQCGIPLIAASGKNSMSGMDRFLSGAVCMGDILQASGYQLTYMGGADPGFAGKGKFYLSHGFTEIIGKNELIQSQEDKTYQHSWGVYDDVLFENAFEMFESLSGTDQPFALFTLTLDTHHPNGHLSASCSDHKYRDGTNPILNAVSCSDMLITRFIRKIIESDHAENTLIVIGSDHPAFRNTAWDRLTRGERKNMLIIVDPASQDQATIDKPGSILDVAPTVLDLLGFDMPALGLGRNLLNDEPTLVEELYNINHSINTWNQELTAFWQYPEIGLSGILVDAGQNHLEIEDRRIGLPVLVKFSEQGKIDNIYFSFDTDRSLSSYVKEWRPSTPILWIDDLKKMRNFIPGYPDTRLGLFLGKIGGDSVCAQGIEDSRHIRQEELLEYIAGDHYPELAAARKDIPEEVTFSLHDSPDAGGLIYIRSQGLYMDQSYISSGKNWELLERGVSLIGIKNSIQWDILSRFDHCGNTEGPQVAVEPFSDIINQFSDTYAVYAIVVHDSIKCGQDAFPSLFQNNELEKLGKLKSRQPYIAIVSSEGEKHLEIDNEAGGAIKLTLENFTLFENDRQAAVTTEPPLP